MMWLLYSDWALPLMKAKQHVVKSSLRGNILHADEHNLHLWLLTVMLTRSVS